jgi:hypothetical protein
LQAAEKHPRSPFDKLRVNGGGIENINDFSIMLSVSKHESIFSATW